MSKHPLIRMAREADLDAMVALLAELFAIERDFMVDAGKQLAALEMLLASDQAEVLVADHGGEVVGMCSMQRLVSTAEGGWAGLIEDVVVSEVFRGQGIGSLLLQSMARRATAWGITRLQLLADRDNDAALAFYAGSGWQATQLVVLRERI